MSYLLRRFGIASVCALIAAMLGSLFFALAHALNCTLTLQFSAPDWSLMREAAIVGAAVGLLVSRAVHYD